MRARALPSRAPSLANGTKCSPITQHFPGVFRVYESPAMRAQRNASNKRVATSDKNKNRRVATRDKYNCRRVACPKSSASCRHFFCRLPASQQMLRAYDLSPHICRHTFVATHLSTHICRHTFVATHLSPQHRSCNYASGLQFVTIRAELKFDPCRTQSESKAQCRVLLLSKEASSLRHEPPAAPLRVRVTGGGVGCH